MKNQHHNKYLYIKNYPATIKIASVIHVLSHSEQIMSAIQLVYLNYLISQEEKGKNYQEISEKLFLL